MIPDQLRLVPIFIKFSESARCTCRPLPRRTSSSSSPPAAQLFLMRQYFLTIPRDLEEAAKLDGAGYFKTFWKVMLPLAGPAIAAVAILEFEGTWNDFFWPLIIFNTAPDHYTLPVGIFSFVSEYQTLWPQLMAGSVIAIAADRARLRRLPALLRRRRRLGRSEGMSSVGRRALRARPRGRPLRAVLAAARS